MHLNDDLLTLIDPSILMQIISINHV